MTQQLIYLNALNQQKQKTKNIICSFGVNDDVALYPARQFYFFGLAFGREMFIRANATGRRNYLNFLVAKANSTKSTPNQTAIVM